MDDIPRAIIDDMPRWYSLHDDRRKSLFAKARQRFAVSVSGPVGLSRPDEHVAWRGNENPADSLALIDRVRGALQAGG